MWDLDVLKRRDGSSRPSVGLILLVFRGFRGYDLTCNYVRPQLTNGYCDQCMGLFYVLRVIHEVCDP